MIWYYGPARGPGPTRVLPPIHEGRVLPPSHEGRSPTKIEVGETVNEGNEGRRSRCRLRESDGGETGRSLRRQDVMGEQVSHVGYGETSRVRRATTCQETRDAVSAWGPVSKPRSPRPSGRRRDPTPPGPTGEFALSHSYSSTGNLTPPK